MSRSYKKTPVYKDTAGKGVKAIANRRVRAKTKENPDAVGKNNAYKKITESWNISDYFFYCDENTYRDQYNEWKKAPEGSWKKQYADEFKDIDEWMQQWKKYYKRK